MEYQAKEVFRKYQIQTPNEKMAQNPEEALEFAQDIGFPLVVKAQVPVGGRGKAGGIKLANNADEARSYAQQILGMNIKQCNVKKILISQALPLNHEYYISVTLDRTIQKPIFIVSPSGGVDIEEIGRTQPEKIFQLPVDLLLGIKAYQLKKVFQYCFQQEENPPSIQEFSELLEKMYALYLKEDASLVEINPLVVIDKKFVALDAKLIIDDNALYRHASYQQWLDEDPEETTQERLARSAGLSYISLEGNIACIVNGAGLAMATMDVVKHWGGDPANFLDIGGSSNPEKMVNALKIVLSNAKVNSVLINIFGGITRCDDIASGLIQAIQTTSFKLPLSVRLIGTNDESARAMLKQHQIEVFTDMNLAIKRAVMHSREAGI